MMLGTNGRTGTAEKLAEQLMSAASSAGDTARGTAKTVSKATSGLATDAGGQVGAVADEARRRALAAVDALAGRRTATPWPWLFGAAALGLVVGWAAAAVTKRAMTREEETIYGVAEVEEPIEPLR
jgi:hypothetical protein